MSQDSFALEIWREILLKTITDDNFDLSLRQLMLLLEIYLYDGRHTVKTLAEATGINKSAISRALDRLSRLGFIKRKVDDNDRRSQLLLKTVKGSVFLTDIAEVSARIYRKHL
jgi:DNA-binding MarR family transcriptional regulator